MDSGNAAPNAVKAKAVLGVIACCLSGAYVYADAQPSAAQQVAVTFFTEPANASLYSPSGGLYGASPLTLYYQVPPAWEDCVELEPLQAVWVSGAESEVALNACPENSHNQHFTFVRPDLVGADLDTWFAEKVEQLAMVEDPVSLSRNPAHAARVDTLSGNLVSCSDHIQSVNGCR